MSLSFTKPIFLLALLLLLPLVYYWRRMPTSLSPRRKRDALLLRLLTVTCLVLGLAGAEVVTDSKNLSVVFLLDRSLSTGGDSQAWERHFLANALKGKGKDDQFGVVLFGGDSGIEVPTGAHSMKEVGQFASVVDQQSTQLLTALRYASTSFPGDTARRLVVLTDGRSTEGDAEQEVQALSQAGIEVWLVPQPGQKERDVLLSKLEAPAQASLNEPFLLRAVVESRGIDECQLLITENGVPKQNLQLKLKDGPNLFLLPQRQKKPGPVRYEARIVSKLDTRLQNNKGESLTLVGGEQTVIVLRQDDGPGSLVPLLSRAGIKAVALQPNDLPRAAGAWRNVSALVIEDVDSLGWDKRLQTLVSLLVREGGMGLMMCGSDSTFGVGAYQSTPIEPLLPVNLSIRRPKDQPLSALIQLIDKSGSMSGEPLKMAREAAIAAGETLSERDFLGVIGFDSAARWVVKLQPKGDGGALRKGVSTLRAGGGTDLYPALKEGLNTLRNTSAPLKHIIVLSDGAVEDADFEELLRMANQERVTISAVAFGEGADVTFLENLTKKGKGRLFRSEDTQEGSTLAQIFIRDTVLATGSGIQDKPSEARPTQSGLDSPILAGLNLQASPSLLAYNMSSSKGGTAKNLLQTAKKDPILAVGRAGLGNTAAWLSDLGGTWAKPWDQVAVAGSQASLLETLLLRTVRGVVSSETLPLAARGNYLRVSSTGSGELGTLDLDISTRKPLTGPLRVVAISREGKTREATLHPEGPFAARGTIRVTEPGSGLVLVQDSEGNLMGRTNFSIPLAPEFAKLGTDAQAMKRWAQAPMSRFDPPPEDVFQAPLEPVPSRTPLEQDLIRGALLLLLLEIAVRRLPSPRLGRASGTTTTVTTSESQSQRFTALREKKNALARGKDSSALSRLKKPVIERGKASVPKTIEPGSKESTSEQTDTASTLAQLKKSREKRSR